MTPRRLIPLVLLAMVATRAAADTWSLGYAVTPVTYYFCIDDANDAGGVDKQGKDSFSLGQLALLYDHDRKVSDAMHLSLVTGIGFPVGTGKHDATSEYINPAANTSKNTLNTDDSIEISALTVPVLLGVKYAMPAGENAMSLGLMAGALIVGGEMTDTQTSWSGTAPTQAVSGTVVTYNRYVVPTWEILASFGYHMRQGEGQALSLIAQIGMIGEARLDTETANTNPGNSITPQRVGGVVGGLTFGVNIGWSKSF
ncbi:MAG: hypothetical protein AAB152_11250 [Candidatus Coatesbacteria bacterium]